MTKSGFVSIVGRPNSGKSTLLNRLVGEKISIVSDKPQTTRRVVRGIVTRPEGQVIFLDTPGIHKPIHRMNERMMKSVREALSGVDLIALMADAAAAFGRGDQFALELIKPVTCPKILLLNKIDRVQKNTLLPMIDRYSRLEKFEEIVPLSALTGENVDSVVGLLFRHLAEGPLFYPADQLSDQHERAIAAEMIREKLIDLTEQELPYSTAVAIDRFEEADDIHRIFASIFVERESQKAIVIGKAGQKLKEIGVRAREDLESCLRRRIFIEL
jgi:GTP-binding protein Era